MDEKVTITREVLYNDSVVTLSLEYYKDGDTLYEDEQLKKDNDRRVMDAARKSLGYLSSAEIREIRSRYTEDPELFGQLLGFPKGEMTRYEDMYFPNRMDDYTIGAQGEPLVFLGSLFRKRYTLTFPVFIELLMRILCMEDLHIDKKSVQNLEAKWGNYDNEHFFIEYVLTLGGGIFTFNDYERATHGFQEEVRYMKTRINEYPKDTIKIENLKEEIQFYLQEEKLHAELGFKTYVIKGWTKDWEARQDELEG